MKKKFFGIFVIIAIMFFGCGSNDNPATPDDETGGDGSSITLSGTESGSFDNMQVSILLDSGWVEIAISDADATHGVMLMSDFTSTGEYVIPEQFTGVYSNAVSSKMYEFFEGTVSINSISSNSVSGSFTARGYQWDVNTYQIDSTKILTVSGSFSK